MGWYKALSGSYSICKQLLAIMHMYKVRLIALPMKNIVVGPLIRSFCASY